MLKVPKVEHWVTVPQMKDVEPKSLSSPSNHAIPHFVKNISYQHVDDSILDAACCRDQPSIFKCDLKMRKRGGYQHEQLSFPH